MRYKVAIRLAIDGDVRFISHHDTMRLFERAASRARLPIRYSEGFNPRARLSLPLPRPVGVAAKDDLLVLEMHQPCDAAAVLASLSEQMPEGIQLFGAEALGEKRSPQPTQAQFVLEVPPDRVADVHEQTRRLIERASWEVERRKPKAKSGKTVELRPLLLEAIVEGTTLRWTVRIDQGATIRPTELLSAIGLEPKDWHHKVCRVGVAWDFDPVANTPETPGTGYPAD